MRKRQWKKILSVVLALAMVFSMNVSAFADEVTDPVAVEEPAAEQPVEETAEEPAAPAEEEPAAEEAAPAEEPAAEEAAPAEEEAPADSEEAAGGLTGDPLPSGWTADGEASGSYSEEDETLTLTGDATLTAGDVTTTLSIIANAAATVTLGSGTAAMCDGEVTTTGTVALVADDTCTLYKYVSSGTDTDEFSFEASNTAGKIIVNDDIDVWKADGSEEITGDLEANTAYLFVGAVKISANNSPDWTKADDPTTAEDSLTADQGGIYIDTDVNGGEYYIAKSSTAPTRETEADGNLDGSGDATILPDDGSGDYYAWVRVPATADTTFASEWVATKPAKVTVDVENMVGTVSGMTFTPDGDSTWSKGTSDNSGIYTVNILTGTVEMEPETSLGNVKSLSVNVVEGATLIADSAINGAVPVSLQGKGTVIFEAPSSYEGVAADVQLSGNGAADTALVAKTTAANGDVDYYIVENDVDAAAKAKAGALAIVSTTAANTTSTKIDFDAETINAPYVLSENKKVFVAGGTLTVSATEIIGTSVEFGHGKLLIAADENPSATEYSFVVVPGRDVNKFPAGLVDGQQTDNGIDVSRGTTEQAGMATQYEFILSTNNTATQADTLGWTWQTTGTEITAIANGAAKEAGKTYYLYARKKATVGKFFRSEAKVIGSLAILKETNVSLNKASGKALSPNYIGDVDYLSDEEALAFFEKQSDKVLNSGFFSFDFKYPSATEVPGIHVTENFDADDDDDDKLAAYKDNILWVRDSDDFVIGKITLNIRRGTAVNTYGDFSTTTAYKLYNLEPADYGYGVKIKFESAGNAGATYGTMNYDDGINVVSFNILPAPVKYEPVVVTPALSGNVTIPTFKATNQITGAELINKTALTPWNEFAGQDVSYFIDGKKADSESWNNATKGLKAGTYKIGISNNGTTKLSNPNYYTEKEDGADKADYSTEATLTVAAPDDLAVVAKFVDNAKPVYYGTNTTFVKNQIEGYFTVGGVKTGDEAAADKSKLVFLASPSDNLAKATKLTDDTIKTISAGQVIYAYFQDVTYGTKTISSAALEVPVQKRPVDLAYTGTTPATFRGEDLLTKVSTNDITGTPVGADYSITAAPFAAPIAATALLDSAHQVDVPLDTSLLDKNKAVKNGKATLALTDANLSSNFATNYTIGKTNLNYDVKGRYYIKYILEYGGKKYVSSNVVDTQAATFNIKPSDIKSVSWGSADGKDEGVLGKDNLITRWEAKRENLDDDYSGWIPVINTYSFAYDATQNVNAGDYAVYAVVTAVATKNGEKSSVMVESITPVRYDGSSHVARDDQKGNNHGDLRVVVYDQVEIVDTKTYGNDSYQNPKDPYYNEWTKISAKALAGGKLKDGTNAGDVDVWRVNLVNKVDYTISYKNNKNASVTYDPTVSGDDATFKQLFPENKRPQVIIKGKGDYKKMKATVLFDILPAEIDGVDGIKLFYEPNKKLKVGEKPYAWIYTNYVKALETAGDKGMKKTILKEGKYNAAKDIYTKDYVKEIYRITRDSADAIAKKELVDAAGLKKIAAGEYQVSIKGVNNFYGTYTRTVNVKSAILLDKQTFKWTKKKDWSSTPLTIADFKVSVKDKKKKTAIDIIPAAEWNGDKPGVYVSSIKKKTGKDTWMNVAGDETYKFADAGVYRVRFTANDKLFETNSIVGTKDIDITVKGVKVKASDFQINGGKKLEYTGKDTPVTVTLKKPDKFKTDEYSKIPLASSAKNINATTEALAVTGYTGKYGTGTYDDDFKLRSSWKDNSGYTDLGAKLKGTLVKSNVYSVGYVADNANLDYTYSIYIKPSGKYYTEEGNGAYVKLTYKYSVINLNDAGKTGSPVKVLMNDVEANIGGTSPDLKFCVSGASFAGGTVSGGMRYYELGTTNGQKGQIWITDTNPTPNTYTLNVIYKNNKKTGKATATIQAADKASKAVFKGKAVVPYNIVDRKVDEILPYDAHALVADAVVADITDAVEPKGNKKAAPIVKLYQVDETASKITALKKNDFAWAIGKTVSGSGIEIDTTAPAAGSFSFVDKDKFKSGGATLVAGIFNVYGAKTKVKATLSQGSGSGYDQTQKGYIYTGKQIKPGVIKLIYGDKDINIPAGATESGNFIVKYNNNTKVGTATATVTLKRDTTLSENQYPYGGSVVVKFKIVPQTNQNLILSE